MFSDLAIDDLKQHLSSETFRYIFSPKFIFLCGKGFDKRIPNAYLDTNRGIIQQYIKTKAPKSYIVLSEQLWENGLLADIDLLTFEEFLAEVSDCIILFVESMGSACELGAFTFEEKLFMEKLILVLNEKYKDDDSFINHGPIAKAKKNNTPVVYADLDGALLSSRELLSETNRIIGQMSEKCKLNKRSVNKANEVNLSSFLVEIIELIRLLQPITSDELVTVYKKIKSFSSFDFVKKNGQPFNSKIHLNYLLKLLTSVSILKQDKEQYFLSDSNSANNLMFSFSSSTLSRARNRILSRKYKYKG